MKHWNSEITLSGKNVTLRPLTTDDKASLREASKDGSLWELAYTSVPEPHETEEYISRAIHEFKTDQSNAFAVVHNTTKKVIGTTRYCNINPTEKSIEIGFTWYAKSFQQSGINWECKLLLLSFAFEELGFDTVEFRTHHLNFPSQKSIEKLGANFNGIIKNHSIDRIGRIRNSIVYSISKSEWSRTKQKLEERINKYRS